MFILLGIGCLSYFNTDSYIMICFWFFNKGWKEKPNELALKSICNSPDTCGSHYPLF